MNYNLIINTAYFVYGKNKYLTNFGQVSMTGIYFKISIYTNKINNITHASDFQLITEA